MMSDQAAAVLLRFDGAVATLMLNRPDKLNPWIAIQSRLLAGWWRNWMGGRIFVWCV